MLRVVAVVWNVVVVAMLTWMLHCAGWGNAGQFLGWVLLLAIVATILLPWRAVVHATTIGTVILCGGLFGAMVPLAAWEEYPRDEAIGVCVVSAVACFAGIGASVIGARRLLAAEARQDQLRPLS